MTNTHDWLQIHRGQAPLIVSFPHTGTELPASHVDHFVSPWLARGLNYYTGAIFEVKAQDFAIGSICGGGRYDDLTGIFGLKNMSGVGISFGADRIYDVLLGLDKFPGEVINAPRLVFFNLGEEEAAEALAYMKKLRDAGVACELYPDALKLKKQFDYATRRGVQQVVIIGREELTNKQVTVKDLLTGEQQTIEGQGFLNMFGVPV